MPFTRLASFPNARPIKVTRKAKTTSVDMSLVVVGTPFLISPLKANRTRITVSNRTQGKLKYGYSNSNTTAPVLSEMAFDLESMLAIDTDSLQAIWGIVESVSGEIQIDEGEA